jgi:hypothetical protein
MCVINNNENNVSMSNVSLMSINAMCNVNVVMASNINVLCSIIIIIIFNININGNICIIQW